MTDIVLEFALQAAWNKFALIKLENGKVKSGKLPLNYLGDDGFDRVKQSWGSVVPVRKPCISRQL